jgi:hypothetical protein
MRHRERNDDGFRAYLEPVSDPAFDGAAWDHLVLVVDLLGSDVRHPFRSVPSELWGVDNNLNIANMDWEEFANSVDESGVFRGFGS